MLKKISLLILCSFLWCTNVLADCYTINNSDEKYYCLAISKQEMYQCYNIKDSDKKYYCLAKLNSNNMICYNIKNNNLKNICLNKF